MKSINIVSKKISVFAIFFVLFGSLFSSFAYASASSTFFDISIDRVRLNGQAIAPSSTNLINDANVFSVLVDITSVGTVENGHIEAILRGRSAGKTVSDSTATFNLAKGQKTASTLTLSLIDGLKSEREYDLTIKVIDAKGNSEQKSYGVATKTSSSIGKLDLSIDRARINGEVITPSNSNFITRSNDFDVLVEITALEDMENAHMEAILKDALSGTVVSDATSNFNLLQDARTSRLLSLHLLDGMRKSDSFQLTIRILNADGDSISKTYGLRTKGRFLSTNLRNLDISINSVDVEDKTLAENENNFVVITGTSKKNLNVRVGMTSLENVDNARVDAVLSFENGDVVADTTSIFNMNDGETAFKDLQLPLIGKFDQNKFTLRVKVTDAEGDSEEKSYGLKISTNKFPFVISSISAEPDRIESGKSVDVKVMFKNAGVVPLNGLKMTVSIPELDVSSARYIDASKSNMPDITEHFLLKIFEDAQTGAYTIRSEIKSQFGTESEVKELPIYILGKEDQPVLLPTGQLSVIAPQRQDMKNDGTEVAYPLTFKNEGPGSAAYVLLLDGRGWANLRLTESNVFILRPGETRTVNVLASTTASKGEHVFLAEVKSSGKLLKQVPLRANVVQTANNSGIILLLNALEIFLVIAVLALFAAGVYFGVRRLNEENGAPSEPVNTEPMYKPEAESYY